MMGPVRFETEPNRTEIGSVRDFEKISRFGSVRFEIFSVRFGSVPRCSEPISFRYIF